MLAVYYLERHRVISSYNVVSFLAMLLSFREAALITWEEMKPTSLSTP